MKPALACLASTVACLVAAAGAHAAASYTDPVGDSQTAPDILAVSAVHDSAGMLTFTVRTDRPALEVDTLLLLGFDTDKNPGTGRDGAEFLFGITSTGWEFLRWDGANFLPGNAASANGSYANGLATFKIGKADLRVSSGFSFYAGTAHFDASGAIDAVDVAPDTTERYAYALTPVATVRPKQLTLRAAAATFLPARPTPGKPLTIRLRVTRGDTGGPLAAGKATCRVTIGGKAIRATGSIRAGVATCSLKVPAAARKKRLRGTVTVSFAGVSVSRAFSKLL